MCIRDRHYKPNNGDITCGTSDLRVLAIAEEKGWYHFGKIGETFVTGPTITARLKAAKVTEKAEVDNSGK